MLAHLLQVLYQRWWLYTVSYKKTPTQFFCDTVGKYGQIWIICQYCIVGQEAVLPYFKSAANKTQKLLTLNKSGELKYVVNVNEQLYNVAEHSRFAR